MTDPGEDIAEALVEFVAALDSPVVSMNASVEKTDNPLKALDGLQQTLKVLFYATSEEAERIGRGGQVLERFVVSMMVARKVDTDVSKRQLANYTRELKAAIRGERMAGYPQTGEVTPVKCDAQQMFEQNQFVSVSEFTYSKAGRDE